VERKEPSFCFDAYLKKSFVLMMRDWCGLEIENPFFYPLEVQSEISHIEVKVTDDHSCLILDGDLDKIWQWTKNTPLWFYSNL